MTSGHAALDVSEIAPFFVHGKPKYDFALNILSCLFIDWLVVIYRIYLVETLYLN